MTPEEKLNAENFLRRQIFYESRRFENFHTAIHRPGFSGGNIIINDKDGNFSGFHIRDTDDLQDIIDFVSVLYKKRIKILQQRIEEIQEK